MGFLFHFILLDVLQVSILCLVLLTTFNKQLGKIFHVIHKMMTSSRTLLYHQIPNDNVLDEG